MKSTLAVSILSLLAGAACYGAAPPRPAPVPLPPLEPGARVAVTSEDVTRMEDVPKKSVTCPAGHVEGSPECVVTQYSEQEEVTRTHTTATYGGQPIDLAQFTVLTDPDHDAKLARLEELSRRCHGANTPRRIGAGLSIAGALLLTIAVATQEKAFTYAGLGTLGGGIGAYAYGYYSYGGNRCDEASALYRELELSGSIGQTTAVGAERAAEMKALADRFNAGAAAAAARR